MAEVQSESSGAKSKHTRGPRQKKRSTRIDMTAMVDVAFLLLTFFILTTTLAKPYVLPAVKPPLSETNRNQPVKQSKVLTLILGAEDQVHYYTGMGDTVHTTDFSATGLRQVVVQHLQKYPNLCRDANNAPGCWDPIVVIKPHDHCSYRNLVDALDEMRIVRAPKYALDDVLAEDSLLLAANGLR
ncbi:MAG: biopolymer transporter ExbD [Bacteroidota bacterium]